MDFKRRPPKELLAKFHVDIPSDTPFRSWCRLKQSIWRESQDLACGSEGDPAELLGSRLTEDDAKVEGWNFINKAIFAAAKERLAKENREPGDVIESNRLFGNTLTSQTLCFNLFLPQSKDLRLATKIWATLLPETVAEVTCVKVESSPGRGPTSAFGTGDHSSFDALVEYVHRDGSSGVLAIETKYTDSFSAKGKTPTAREEGLVKSTKLFSDEGWEDLKVSKGTQQLWRTHLLAETMRSARLRHITYLVLHADGDKECLDSLKIHTQALLHHRKATELFKSMTLESFVDRVKSKMTGDDAVWLDKFRLRYLDWSPVEAEVVLRKN